MIINLELESEVEEVEESLEMKVVTQGENLGEGDTLQQNSCAILNFDQLAYVEKYASDIRALLSCITNFQCSILGQI